MTAHEQTPDPPLAQLHVDTPPHFGFWQAVRLVKAAHVEPQLGEQHGLTVGEAVGARVGAAVGDRVGALVGERVGAAVGAV